MRLLSFLIFFSFCAHGQDLSRLKQQLKYNPKIQRDPLLFSFMPEYLQYKIKFTIKVGFNSTTLKNALPKDATGKLDVASLSLDEFVSDLDQDVFNTFKYDARAKLYITKIYRLLLRVQINKPNNLYSLGFIMKF